MRQDTISLDMQSLSGDDIATLLRPLRVSSTTVAVKYIEDSCWGYRYSGNDNFALLYFFWGCEGFVQLKEQSRNHFHTGDIIILPQVCSHLVCGTDVESMVDLNFTNVNDISDKSYTFKLASIRNNGDVVEIGSHRAKPTSHGFTAILMKLDSNGMSPLLRYLPPSLHVKAVSGATADWIHCLARMMKDEMSGQTSSIVCQRLNELFLVKCVTEYFDQRQKTLSSRFSLQHPRVEALICEMNSNPERFPRSLAAMANEVAMSRSSFSSLFKSITGISPIKYLRQLQMQQATRLIDRGLSVCEIANVYQYESDFAFRRAFKQEVGISPTRYSKGCAPQS